MINHILIENNIVIRVDCNPFLGSIEYIGEVYCGQIYNAETGGFTNPSKTYSQRLAELNANKKSKEKDFCGKICFNSW